MLSTGKITAFVASVMPERAKQFYRDTLGLHLVSDDQFAVVFDSGGIQLRIQKLKAFQPHSFTTLGWQVPDIRRSVTALVKRGVTFERYNFMEQDALGIWESPSGARVAWFKDPDGNLLSLGEGGLLNKRSQPTKARRPGSGREAKARRRR